ncbi:PAS domain-containing protein [Pseudomonas asiatica]|nr:PAS domain-containing protein [Pseudomonas asiatica]UYP82998.1 PAS domain-containing protein [Pseudomonas asiatica]
MIIKAAAGRVCSRQNAEGVLITDIDQHISAVNRAFSEITGYSEIEALGQTADRLTRSTQALARP